MEFLESTLADDSASGRMWLAAYLWHETTATCSVLPLSSTSTLKRIKIRPDDSAAAALACLMKS